MSQEDLNKFFDANSANDLPITRPFNYDLSAFNECNLNGYIQDSKTNYIDMRVPDKIMVLGNNKYAEATGPPRETAFENEMLSFASSDYLPIQVPEVLTLDDFSMTEKENEATQRVKQRTINGHDNNSERIAINEMTSDKQNRRLSSNVDMSMTMDNIDNDQLHEELTRLCRKVMRIEKECRELKRQNRNLFYLSCLFLMFEFISWLRK